MFDAIHFDITRPSDYQEAYKYFDKNFGRLDILINNAGVSKELIGVPNNASSVSQAILRETFDTNFFGTIELTQALLPLIRKAPEGRIVNLSSILGSLTLRADPKIPHLRVQGLSVQRFESGIKRLHRTSWCGVARYKDQGQLRTPRLGEDGDGDRRGPHGDSRRSQDERAARAGVCQWTYRRIFPYERSAAW